jgi:hypothetical protein
MHLRSEPLFHRVLKDVIRNSLQIVISPQCSVEVTDLPERAPGLLFIKESRPLLEQRDELFQVRRAVLSLRENMSVVRHEAVGKQRKTAGLR